MEIHVFFYRVMPSDINEIKNDHICYRSSVIFKLLQKRQGVYLIIAEPK